MAEKDAQDRNLPASARKLKKAREEGQIARSRDLGNFAVVGAAALLLSALAPKAAGVLKDMLAQALRFDAQELAQSDVMLKRMAEPLTAWLSIDLMVNAVLVTAAILAALASND